MSQPDVGILIVDDDALLRYALRAALGAAPGLKIIGEACDGLEAVRQATALRPDLILMDFKLPTVSGVEVVVQLKRSVPSARIVVLSGFSDPASVRRILDAGADTYVSKGCAPEELLRTIRRLAARASPASTDPNALSATECEVCQRIARGCAPVEIARALGLELATVEAHRAAAMSKLQVSSHAELARLVAERGWE